MLVRPVKAPPVWTAACPVAYGVTCAPPCAAGLGNCSVRVAALHNAQRPDPPPGGGRGGGGGGGAAAAGGGVGGAG
jgi:hypothetical protein